MHVLEDGDHRTALQCVEKGGEDGRAIGVCCEESCQVFLRVRRHIVQRTERARRKQGIAGAPQHTNGIRLPAHELIDEHGFADASLTAHQSDVAHATDHLAQSRA